MEENLQQIKQTQKQLRNRFLKERNAISPEEKSNLDKQIFEQLTDYDAENPASVYLCYVNYKSEAATKDYISWCLEQKKSVFVPKVELSGKDIESEKRRMEFYRIFDLGDLSEGYQGILEPKAAVERAFSTWIAEQYQEKALKRNKIRMLLPGAVFDQMGNRIGYGGGFYDRWLENWRKQQDELGRFESADSQNMFHLEKIGLAYQIQVTDRIPAAETDQKTDLLITENGREVFYGTGTTL